MSVTYKSSRVNYLTGYLPAVLKQNTRGWYIEYAVYNPASGQNERVRQNLNVLRKRLSLAEFRRQASMIVCDINTKLAGGWSPFTPATNVMQYVTLREAFDDYLRIKGRDLRKSTLVSYQSVIDILLRYLDDMHAGNCHASALTHYLAVRFMDYLASDTDINCRKKKALSNNAWNTYLKKYLAICSWLLEREYIKVNPFAGIKTKPKEDKRRQLITATDRAKLLEYLQRHNPNYIMVLHLIYNSLIRPKEIETIRIQDINLQEHWVCIPAKYAKTHKERYAPLVEQECKLLESWHLERYPKHYYLIGSDYKPSPTPTYHGKFKKDFMAMRKHLHLGDGVQLYSFKDTGISDLFAAGLDALTVMRAADHHDLTVTTRYAQQANTDMINKVRAAAITM